MKKRKNIFFSKTSEILGNFFALHNKNPFKNQIYCERLKQNWSEIVGANVFKIGYPVNIKNDTLYIKVFSASGLQEFSSQSEDIIIKVNHFSKQKKIKGQWIRNLRFTFEGADV